MRNLVIPALLIVLGVVGFGMRERTPRMDAAAAKAEELKKIVRRTKERIAALRKERHDIIANHQQELDRLKKDKVSRDIESL